MMTILFQTFKENIYCRRSFRETHCKVECETMKNKRKLTVENQILTAGFEKHCYSILLLFISFIKCNSLQGQAVLFSLMRFKKEQQLLFKTFENMFILRQNYSRLAKAMVNNQTSRSSQNFIIFESALKFLSCLSPDRKFTLIHCHRRSSRKTSNYRQLFRQ